MGFPKSIGSPVYIFFTNSFLNNSGSPTNICDNDNYNDNDDDDNDDDDDDNDNDIFTKMISSANPYAKELENDIDLLITS